MYCNSFHLLSSRIHGIHCESYICLLDICVAKLHWPKEMKKKWKKLLFYIDQ